jgi:hypothetical protein
MHGCTLTTGDDISVVDLNTMQAVDDIKVGPTVVRDG